MRRTVFSLILLAVVCFVAASGGAEKEKGRDDRPIVFAAQRYKWSGKYYHWSGGEKPEETLADDGTSHLFRVNPDGSRLTQITFGKTDDTEPHWSPDGRAILFLRNPCEMREAKAKLPPSQVCVITAEGQSLLAFPIPLQNIRACCGGTYRGSDTLDDCAWSPDGKSVAAVASTPDGAGKVITYVFTLADGRRKAFPGVESFRWSPDGRYIFLQGESYSDAPTPRILDTRTGKTTRLSLKAIDAVWLDATHLFYSSCASGADGGRIACLFDARSGATERIDWRFFDTNGKLRSNREANFYMVSGRWFRLPANRLLLETFNSRSDGGERTTYVADLGKKTIGFLHAGYIVAASPDGKRCAVATDDWAGPYKRGGRRCGPLEVISTVTGKGKAITPRLMLFLGGDWR